VLVVINSDKFLSGTVFPRRLEGKVVVVTGSASGIGEIVAKKLANHGAQVVMLDVSAQGLKRVSNEITKNGGVAFSYMCDVSDVKAISSMATKVKAKFPKGVDILINNAGVVGEGKNLLDWSNEDLAKTMGINVLGPLFMIKVFMKDMIKRDQGRIVNVASSAGRSYACRLSAYCASKAALIHANNSLRLELRRANSKVATSLLMPWHVNTRMFNGVTFWWPIRWIFPGLKAEVVANRIVSMATARPGVHHEETMPLQVHWSLVLLSIMPTALTDYITELAGGRHGMDGWIKAKVR